MTVKKIDLQSTYSYCRDGELLEIVRGDGVKDHPTGIFLLSSKVSDEIKAVKGIENINNEIFPIGL